MSALQAVAPPPLVVPTDPSDALKAEVRAIVDVGRWVDNLEQRTMDMGMMLVRGDESDAFARPLDIREMAYERPTERNALREWFRYHNGMRNRLYSQLSEAISNDPSIQSVVGISATGPYDLRVFLDNLSVWIRDLQLAIGPPSPAPPEESLRRQRDERTPARRPPRQRVEGREAPHPRSSPPLASPNYLETNADWKRLGADRHGVDRLTDYIGNRSCCARCGGTCGDSEKCSAKYMHVDRNLPEAHRRPVRITSYSKDQGILEISDGHGGTWSICRHDTFYNNCRRRHPEPPVHRCTLCGEKGHIHRVCPTFRPSFVRAAVERLDALTNPDIEMHGDMDNGASPTGSAARAAAPAAPVGFAPATTLLPPLARHLVSAGARWWKVVVRQVQPADVPARNWAPYVGCTANGRPDGERSWVMHNRDAMPEQWRSREYDVLDTLFPLQLPLNYPADSHLVGLPHVTPYTGLNMTLTNQHILDLFGPDHRHRLESIFARAPVPCTWRDYKEKKKSDDKKANRLKKAIADLEAELVDNKELQAAHFHVPGSEETRLQGVDGAPSVAGVQVLVHFPSPHNDTAVLTDRAYATNTLLDHDLLQPDFFHRAFHFCAYNLFPIMCPLDPTPNRKGMRLARVPLDQPSLPYPINIKKFCINDRVELHITFLNSSRAMVVLVMGRECGLWLEELEKQGAEEDYVFVRKTWSTPILKAYEYGGIDPLYSLLRDLTGKLGAEVPQGPPWSFLKDFKDLVQETRDDAPMARERIKIPMMLAYHPDSPDDGILYIHCPHPQNADEGVYRTAIAQAIDYSVEFISRLVNPDIPSRPKFSYAKHHDAVVLETQHGQKKRRGIPLAKWGPSDDARIQMCNRFESYMKNRQWVSQQIWRPTLVCLPKAIRKGANNTSVKPIEEPTTDNARIMTYLGTEEEFAIRARKYFEHLRGKRMNPAGKQSEAQAATLTQMTLKRTLDEVAKNTVWRMPEDWEIYLAICECCELVDGRFLRISRDSGSPLIYTVAVAGPNSSHPKNGCKKSGSCAICIPAELANLAKCQIKTTRGIRPLDEAETLRYTKIIEKFHEQQRYSTQVPTEEHDVDTPPAHTPNLTPSLLWTSVKPRSTQSYRLSDAQTLRVTNATTSWEVFKQELDAAWRQDPWVPLLDADSLKFILHPGGMGAFLDDFAIMDGIALAERGAGNQVVCLNPNVCTLAMRDEGAAVPLVSRDVGNADIIIVPVHQNLHWLLMFVDLPRKRVYCYDGMGVEDSRYDKFVQCIFGVLRRRDLPTHEKDFTFYRLDGPHQPNYWDCGPFMIAAATAIMSNLVNDTMPNLNWGADANLRHWLLHRLLAGPDEGT